MEQVSGSVSAARTVCHLHGRAELERHGGHPKARESCLQVRVCRWHAHVCAGSPEGGWEEAGHFQELIDAPGVPRSVRM